MAQVSKRKVKPEIEKRMFEMLWSAFTKCTSPGKVQDFLNDLFTTTEKVIIAKRLAIALMLHKGYGYTDICETLKVSPPTVSKVKDWLSLKGEGFRRVLNEIIKDETVAQFWQALAATIGDTLHRKY